MQISVQQAARGGPAPKDLEALLHVILSTLSKLIKLEVMHSSWHPYLVCLVSLISKNIFKEGLPMYSSDYPVKQILLLGIPVPEKHR